MTGNTVVSLEINLCLIFFLADIPRIQVVVTDTDNYIVKNVYFESV